MRTLATWRRLINNEMASNGDDFGKVVYSTLSDAGLDTEFYDGYGGPEGDYFTLWTGEYVYFPIVYDGAEWCGSAPRNPCNIPLAHQGGC